MGIRVFGVRGSQGTSTAKISRQTAVAGKFFARDPLLVICFVFQGGKHNGKTEDAHASYGNAGNDGCDRCRNFTDPED